MKFIQIFVFYLYGRVRADTLVWSDDFDGSNGQLPDSSKWKNDIGGDGWGNQELEYYTNSVSNAALDGNGNLVITARRDNPANYNCWYGRCQYTSARLLTAGKFTKTFGAFEARIKIPIGKGIWPAFWMIGDNISQVGWPQCGEIDIIENVGHEPIAVHGTVHGPGYSAALGLTSTYRLPNNQSFANDFHIYRVDWTTNSITFSVDGNKYATKSTADTKGNKWVFGHPFFIILNLAVGGHWPGSPDQSTVFPQSMIVDYVRVYSKTDSPGASRRGQIRGIGGRCVDIVEGSSSNGTPVQIYDCNGSPAQNWTVSADGSIRALDKCLDVSGSQISNGIPVQIYDCNSSETQKWGSSAAGEIVNINANKCLDVRQPTNQNGTHLQIWECAGTTNQKWTLP